MIRETEHGIGVPAAGGARNPCKLCTPLGACLVYRGIEGCMPFLHGSQGCATYIRRYLISHFREPVDIASSGFSESSAVFGGERDFNTGLDNLRRQYQPRVIGIATTCLTETIGEDMNRLVDAYARTHKGEPDLPALCWASTPSYRGTHMEGFHLAVRAAVEQLAEGGARREGLVNLLPGMVSPEDLRYLRDTLADFELEGILLPDYSDTLDGGSWTEYRRIPEGGTPLASVRATGRAEGTIQFGRAMDRYGTAAHWLETRFDVPAYSMGWPVGVRESDIFFNRLERLSGRPVPERHRKARGRLLDAYADAHKYLYDRTVAVYGEDDLIFAVCALLAEIGMRPVVCASGARSGHLRAGLNAVVPDGADTIRVLEGGDFDDLAGALRDEPPDLLIGHGKGYKLARALDRPLVRVGFPVHDRFGGARLRMLGYDGTLALFDRIVNALLERTQDDSEVGYSYL